jgi:hypothetical protein
VPLLLLFSLLRNCVIGLVRNEKACQSLLLASKLAS